MGLLRLLGRLLVRWPPPLGFRYERFGGIVHLRWPRALVFIDRERSRDLGLDSPPPGMWDGSEQGPLSAPLEAHLQLTNRCSAGCQGCYTGASERGLPREWDLSAWRQAIDRLAGMGVFHLALGGGESALLPWLGEVAAYARSRGLVPNLTTSGLYDDTVVERLSRWASAGLFGQINVSIDGVGEDYAAVRGFDGFQQADRAVRVLRRASRHVGINCVVTRRNFAGLDRLFAYARTRRLREVELLRFKPSGRGARSETYAALRCTDEQNRALLPTVLSLARRHRMRVRLDCSFTPMVVWHQPPPELVRWLAIYGCVGGDLLIAGKPNGALAACSFAPPVEATIDETPRYWHRDGAFAAFRSWPSARAPCSGCTYLPLCRGGCRVVAAHVVGDATAPDPECPRVIAHGVSTRRRLPVIS
ncbi:MAG: radical SAM protein [Myxococcales bacterium]|nr:radical SAM protein [Myxococcota bacterium]MDW8281364.1 radical SAM protein [Myxococcales bacterium]